MNRAILTLNSETQNRRVAAIGGQMSGNLPQITISNGDFKVGITFDAEQKKLVMEVSWGESSTTSSSQAVSHTNSSVSSTSQSSSSTDANQLAPEAPKSAAPTVDKNREIDAAEVAKHNTEKDCWVIVNGQVLDVTKFLPDHPGGKKAILIYAGRDATEEFNMLHKPDVVDKYAPECIIGRAKGSTSHGPQHTGGSTNPANDVGPSTRSKL